MPPAWPPLWQQRPEIELGDCCATGGNRSQVTNHESQKKVDDGIRVKVRHDEDLVCSYEMTATWEPKLRTAAASAAGGAGAGAGYKASCSAWTRAGRRYTRGVPCFGASQ